jgi:putative OPT family oligopeptide transporter
MEHTNTQNSGLPENAYTELKPGEVYNPILPANQVFPEVTPWSVIWGLLMAVIFSAAAAYSGLKIGQVFEAAIPISIIAVGVSAAFKKNNAMSQNVIIQSIGASSGVIVAGAIFTIPGLYILQYKYPEIEVNFFQIFFSSLLGGFLGILFLIPFRKYFVKDMHGQFPFPEATATTEILVTGEKGGKQAGILITSGLVAGVFEFMFSSMKLFGEVYTTRILPFGQYLSDNAKMVFKMSVSPLVFSFGYLVGLKFSLIITVGSLLSWFVFIPLINAIGGVAAGDGGINMFAGMTPEAIFRAYVRPIGIGAIAMAGVIGIIRSSSVIGSAFKLALGSFSASKAKGEDQVERTQKDLKMSTILMLIAVVIAGIFLFLLYGVNITMTQSVVALLTIVIISFLFTTVAANAIAIVGTNPVSGMTLMTLIVSSFVLVGVGLQGSLGMSGALIIGGVVCTALSVAGGFITDLKVGYWIGTTPINQQKWKFLGIVVSSATVGLVIYILAKAYGFVETAATPDPLIAPQANAMAAVIEPLMQPGAQINWMLYAVGAVISVLVYWLGISPLAFALGMFIPLELNTPLIVGGLINHFVSKSSKDKELANARVQRGTLIASGFIAGAALFGVFGAIWLFFGVKLDMHVWDNNEHGAELFALLAFIVLIAYFVWDTVRIKKVD